MPSATTKTLRILVEASGAAAAAKQIAAVDRQVQALGKNKTVGKIGAGVGNVVRNSVILGTVAAGAVAGYMAIAIRDGQEAARVQKILDVAISNSGKVSAEQAKQIQAQSQSLMMLAGVDDETIKAEQTRLVQMGLTGDQVLRLTPLIMDMSKATGRDLLSSTLAVGKATQGNVAGLQRFGVFVDKAKAKVDPFGAVMDALTKKFGGTTQALSGSFETRLAAFRIGLGEIGEDVGIRMLPALTRMADVMGRVVVPAFAKFVDRVMPDIENAMNQFATMLEGGGAAKAIDAIYTSMSALVDLLRIAAEPVKMIVGAFMSLPKEVQTVLVAGFAVNKLSGGMFGSVVGDIFKGGLKGIIGITAATAEVKAGVVNVSGPTLPGGGGGGLPTPTPTGGGGGGGIFSRIGGIIRNAAIPTIGGAVALETAIAINEARSSMAPNLRVLGPRLAVTQPGWNQSMAANLTPRSATVPTGGGPVWNSLPSRIERAVALGMRGAVVRVTVNTDVSIRTAEAARVKFLRSSGSGRVGVNGGATRKVGALER